MTIVLVDKILVALEEVNDHIVYLWWVGNRFVTLKLALDKALIME